MDKVVALLAGLLSFGANSNSNESLREVSKEKWESVIDAKQVTEVIDWKVHEIISVNYYEEDSNLEICNIDDYCVNIDIHNSDPQINEWFEK